MTIKAAVAQRSRTQGMDAPTGIAEVGNLVYVADRRGGHEIDVKEAMIMRTIEMPDSQFPNDIAAAPNGDLFDSDFEANRVYRLGRDRKPEVWLESERLENPNGLIVDSDKLVIATWGPITIPMTFAVNHPVAILRPNSAQTRKLKLLGN